MSRTAKKREPPRLKPVKEIFLSGKHVKARAAAVVVLILMGAGLIAYSLAGMLGSEAGWETIDATSEYGLHNGDSFTFRYLLGSGEQSATAEGKALTALYTQALVECFQQLNSDMTFDGVTNICSINQNPNQALEVGDLLYQVLETMAEAEGRYLYLGPVYSYYATLFSSQEDWEAALVDPLLNEDAAQQAAEFLACANDPSAVSLELLGDNQVRLNVSQDYLQLCQDYGVDSYIDLFWLENAFVVDYLAQTLNQAGYTRGMIASYDGFARSLDSREESYSYYLYDRVGSTIYQAAALACGGGTSLVTFQDYPLDSRDSQRFYEYADGVIRTPYIDPADGLCKSSLRNLTGCSQQLSCAQLALILAPVYLSDSFSLEGLSPLTDGQLGLVYGQEDGVLYTAGASLDVVLLEIDGMTYSLQEVG